MKLIFTIVLLHSGIYTVFSEYDSTCEIPAAPDHGSVVFAGQASRAGGLAIFTCDRGYEIIGKGVLKCLESGDWTFDSPICKDRNRRNEKTTSTAKYDLAFTRAQTTYGIHKTSPSMLTTTRSILANTETTFSRFDSIFKPYFPRQLSNRRCSCLYEGPPQLQAFVGRDILISGSSRVSENATVEFNCGRFGWISNHELVGSQTIACSPCGKWSSEYPTCIRSYTDKNRRNEKPTSTAKYDPALTRAQTTDGIHKTSPSMLTTTRSFLDDTETTILPRFDSIFNSYFRRKTSNRRCSCLYEGPPQLQAFVGRDILTSGSSRVSENATVQFKCRRFGYELVGSQTITCSPCGKWSSEYPTCIRIRSYTGKPAISTVISSAIEPETTTTISTTVKPTRKNVDNPDCNCFYESSPDLVAFVGDYAITNSEVKQNDKVRFYCSDFGYKKMVGNQEVACTGCGRWSDSFPSCVPKSRGEVVLRVENYDLDPSVDNYGKKNMTIASDGNLLINEGSYSFIRCFTSGADNYSSWYIKPGLKEENVMALYGTKEYKGEKVYYSNLHFYDVPLSMSGQYWCKHKDGRKPVPEVTFNIRVIPKLSSEPASNEYCNCLYVSSPDLVAFVRGLAITTSEVKQNDKVRFYCSDFGFKKLVGNQEVTCSGCRRWSGSFPYCAPKAKDDIMLRLESADFDSSVDNYGKKNMTIASDGNLLIKKGSYSFISCFVNDENKHITWYIKPGLESESLMAMVGTEVVKGQKIYYKKLYFYDIQPNMSRQYCCKYEVDGKTTRKITFHIRVIDK